MITGKSDLVWSYAAQFLKFGNALILLPFVLRYLPTEELAFWYLFAAISGFVFLADFGFSNTIIRNIAYVFSGAKYLLKEGIPENDEISENVDIDTTLLAKTISSIKFIYKRLALFSFFLLLIIGSLYIYWVISNKAIENKSRIWTAWIIFMISTMFNFYFLYLNSFLMGRGFVKQAQQATIATNAVYLITSFVGLQYGYGIIAMCVGNCLSIVVNRLLSYCFFYDNFIKTAIKSSIVTIKDKREITKILWYNAQKTGIVILGGFLFSRIGQFFVTSYFSLQIAAQYGLTIQVMTITNGLAGIYFNTFLPKATHHFYKNNLEFVVKNMGISLVLAFLTFFFVFIFYIFFGNYALMLIRSQTFFLPIGPSVLLFLTYFLESQHSTMGSAHAYQNRIPFVKPAIFSGLAVVVLSFLALNFLGVNLWYLIGIQFTVSLSYQNWKWPYDACKYFKTGYFKFYKIGFVEIGRNITHIIKIKES